MVEKSITELVPYAANPRKNKAAVPLVANSIREFGFKVPIVVDRHNVIVATHPKGYRIFTKMSHFDAEKFTRALKRARPRGKNYDDAVDKWLKRNQRKYHYRFANVLD